MTSQALEESCATSYRHSLGSRSCDLALSLRVVSRVHDHSMNGGGVHTVLVTLFGSRSGHAQADCLRSSDAAVVLDSAVRPESVKDGVRCLWGRTLAPGVVWACQAESVSQDAAHA